MMFKVGDILEVTEVTLDGKKTTFTHTSASVSDFASDFRREVVGQEVNYEPNQPPVEKKPKKEDVDYLLKQNDEKNVSSLSAALRCLDNFKLGKPQQNGRLKGDDAPKTDSLLETLKECPSVVDSVNYFSVNKDSMRISAVAFAHYCSMRGNHLEEAEKFWQIVTDPNIVVINKNSPPVVLRAYLMEEEGNNQNFIKSHPVEITALAIKAFNLYVKGQPLYIKDVIGNTDPYPSVLGFEVYSPESVMEYLRVPEPKPVVQTLTTGF